MKANGSKVSGEKRGASEVQNGKTERGGRDLGGSYGIKKGEGIMLDCRELGGSTGLTMRIAERVKKEGEEGSGEVSGIGCMKK